MRVFVTGATGYIGFAVAQAYRRAGHEVHGLARSDSGARLLAASEIYPVRGALQDPASYRSAAEAASLLIHAAMDYQADTFALDRQTVQALIAAGLAGPHPKALIYTSGVWLYGNTGLRRADETTPPAPPAAVRPRPGLEAAVLAAESVRGLVVRPGCVYGRQGGLTAPWFADAVAGRAPTIVGDGSNRWTMVHVDDLADGFLRVGESGMRGEIFNLTDRSRSTLEDLVRAAGGAAGFAGDGRRVPLEQAVQAMGPVAECLALDQHVDSSKAARLLGWNPRHGGFVDEAEICFMAWKALASA